MPKVCATGPRTAVILAGGRGTRLAPVLGTRPKVLAQVGGRPFLAHLLDRLVAEGLRRVVLCTGHGAEEVEAAFGDAYGGLALAYSRETEPSGTGGALRLAARMLDDDPVLVMNGDSACQASLLDFWDWHRTQGAQATVLLAHVADPGRYGRVDVDESGRVVGFVEKDTTSGPGWVSAGVYVLPGALMATVSAGRPVSLEREVLPAWVGWGLYGYRSAGAFLDIGTPASYAAAGAWLGAGREGGCAS
jgi:NDP-sugar pyrophosphorylase family protein